MNLFELFVKIGVDDQASGALSKISSGLGKGIATAAKIDLNPRSPWGERQVLTDGIITILAISIHAPRGGSDA